MNLPRLILLIKFLIIVAQSVHEFLFSPNSQSMLNVLAQMPSRRPDAYDIVREAVRQDDVGQL